MEVELDGIRSPEAQKIIDSYNGNNEEVIEDEDDVGLPSDEIKGNDNEEEEELYAGKYKSVDELKKGIVNIGSNLPQYVIDGMSPEALEKHYSELQKSFSKEGNKTRKHSDKPVQEKTVDDIAEKDKDKDGKPLKVDADLWNELDSTFQATGKITDEQYDKLNAAGIPDAMIDRYLDGIKAEQQAFTNKVYERAGGQEQYNVIKDWAENGGIPEAELAAISRMTDYNQILLALDGVKARYDAANGTNKGTLRGNPVPKAGNKYNSLAEYQADVNDIRYKRDAMFREKVKAKLSRSSLT